MKYLVIYYDGNYTKGKLMASDLPNSSAPHVWGLPDDYMITAVIEIGNVALIRFWIDEEEIYLET